MFNSDFSYLFLGNLYGEIMTEQNVCFVIVSSKHIHTDFMSECLPQKWE